jgi:hypothetical protein
MYGNDGVYRRLGTTKNNSKDVKRGFFVVPASTNARRKKSQKKKDDLSLAIGENYI